MSVISWSKPMVWAVALMARLAVRRAFIRTSVPMAGTHCVPSLRYSVLDVVLKYVSPARPTAGALAYGAALVVP